MNGSSKNNVKARGIGGFMSGVLVLSLSTVIVKVIGLAVKIPLIAILGAEGMGYFNSAYEIYAMLCVISTAGLPTALSMVVSAALEVGDIERAEKAYKSALRVFLLLGGIGSLVMAAFSEQISHAVGNTEARESLLAISPALLLVCISSAVRGYFQGYGDMTPTAISQMIEAIGKLVFGVGLGAFAMTAGMSVARAAAMAVLGLTLGMLLSTVYLLTVRAIKKKTASLVFGASVGGMTRRLLRIALPITLGSAVISSCRIVDMTLILRRLQSAGLSAADANGIYGAYTTLAVPVFSLVPSLVTPISLSLIPRLSAALAGGSDKDAARVTDKALRLTVLLSMPASMGIALYARPILSLLFASESEAIDIAAPLLAILGISVMFSSMITTTNAVLQAHGKTVVPIISMGVGTVVKIILAYLLIGMPSVGAYGAPMSTLVCDLTVTVINLWLIGKQTSDEGECSSLGRVYMRPFFASAIAMVVSYAVYLAFGRIFDGRLPFLVALTVAVGVYFVTAFFFGALGREDVSDLPFGEKLTVIFDKITRKRGINKDS